MPFFLFLVSLSLFAQPAEINFLTTNGLDLCGPADTIRLEIINPGATQMDTLRLTLDLPTGMEYVSGSANVTEVDTSVLNTPLLGLPDLPAGDTMQVELLVKAGCGTDISDLDILYTLDYEVGGVATAVNEIQLLNSFGVPSLTLFNTSHTAGAYMNVGDTYTHSLTLLNASFVDVNRILLIHVASPGLAVISSNLGTLTVSGDTTFLDTDTIVPASDSLVIELTVQVVGCNGHNAEFIVDWGCKSDLCNRLSRDEGVITQIDAFTLNIGRVRTSNNNITPCRPDTVTMVYRNDGLEPNVPGSATIYDLRLGVGVGQNRYRNYNWLTMTDWRIGGTSVNPSTVCDSLNPCYWNFNSDLTVDPDGPGGLSDLDGDGFFDDLASGDSILFTFVMVQTCPADSCPGGNRNMTLFSRTYGVDQCGNNALSYYYWPMWAYRDSYHSLSTSVSPVDLVAGPTGDTLSHEIRLNYSRSNNQCRDNPMSTMFVVLPPGVSIAGTPLFNNVAVNPAFLVQSNDTVYYTYFNDIYNGAGNRLNMDLIADCSASTGFVSVDYGLMSVCDTACPCLDVVLCASAVPFYIHGCSGVNCIGAQTLALDLGRRNFGWGDQARTVAADPVATTAIRKDRVLTYDTLDFALPGRIGSAAFDSLHAVLRYHSTSMPGTRLMDFLQGRVQVYDSNGVFKGTCALPQPDTLILLDTIYFDFNLDRLTCPFTFEDGDSLDVQGLYRVRDDFIPPSAAAINMDFIQGYYEAEVGGVFTVCERWHLSPIQFLVPRPQIVINTGRPCTGWGGSHNSWTRCEPMWLKVGLGYLTTNMNCWSCDFFPSEWRDIANADTFRVVLPQGLEYMTGTSNYYNWYYGQNMPIPDPVFVGDTMVYVLPAGNSPSGSSGCDYRRNLQTVFFQIIPSCTYMLSSSDQVHVIADWDNYLYSADKQVHNERDFRASNLQVSFPSYDFSALTSTALGVTDTAEWVVNVHNTSLSYDTDYNFLYFDDAFGTAGDIEIVEAWNGATQLTVNSLTPGRSWVELGNIPTNGAEQIRLRFVYNTCTLDSVNAYFGYGCGSYPDPTMIDSCLGPQLSLYVRPEPSDLRLSILASPADSVDLCDTLSFELELRNVQLGYATDLVLHAQLPFGGTVPQVVPSSSEIRYPINSPSLTTISDPSLIGANLYEWVFPSSVLLKGVDSLNSSRLTIQFDLITECNVFTNSAFQFDFSAITPCQDTLTSLSQLADPLDIRETTGEPYPYFMDIVSLRPGLQSCDGTPLMTLSLVNNGNDLAGPLGSPDPDTTGMNDHFYLYLPLGVSYIPGSFGGINSWGGLTNPVPTISPYANWTLLDWHLPNGVPKNDSITFSFNLNIDSLFSCDDSIDFRMQTVAGVDAICQTTLGTCPVFFLTGENFDPFLCNCAVLPVSGFDFSAEQQEQAVVLNWNVDLPDAAKGYQVLKGTHPDSLHAIAWKIGTPSERYQHTDPEPFAGSNFYRILRRDEAGNSEYSRVIEVVFAEPGRSVSLQPNPGSGLFHLLFDWEVNAEHTLEVLNSQGQLVYQETRYFEGKKHPLDLEGFSKGLYVVNVKSAERQWKLLLVIQ